MTVEEIAEEEIAEEATISFLASCPRQALRPVEADLRPVLGKGKASTGRFCIGGDNFGQQMLGLYGRNGHHGNLRICCAII